MLTQDVKVYKILIGYIYIYISIYETHAPHKVYKKVMQTIIRARINASIKHQLRNPTIYSTYKVVNEYIT